LVRYLSAYAKLQRSCNSHITSQLYIWLPSLTLHPSDAVIVAVSDVEAAIPVDAAGVGSV